ncbi:hypothetical protein HYW58_02070 [Candidatus Kaiserbacteria bacterium]|nr:hypothetical protein [Candidatus Kaiserbacteria bacterium]
MVATVRDVGSALVITVVFAVTGIVVTYALGHIWFGPFDLSPNTTAEGLSVVGGLMGGGLLGTLVWWLLKNHDGK